MTVIEAALVPRWIQDPPATALSIATVPITATADLSVAVTADAPTGFAATCAVSLPVVGDAQVAADTVLAVSVAVIGDASAAITSTAQSTDVNLTAGIALIPIAASCDVSAAVDCPADIIIFDGSTFIPAVLGDATVDIEDYGQGSSPLFPFQLPTRFTDNPLGIQDAAATIVINGYSDNIQVAAFADAVIGFADYGTVFPYTLPISFEGLQGSAPIFDFVLPIVFSATANVALAVGTLEFTGDADTIVTVTADASAALTAGADRTDPTFFPFLLPAQFIS